MIIASGYNVYPATVERAVFTHPAVAETIVIGVPDDYRGETVKAYVVLNPGHTLELEELQEHLRGAAVADRAAAAARDPRRAAQDGRREAVPQGPTRGGDRRMTDPVLFERDGAVATIRLNRPDRLNAIDAEAAHLLLEACRRAEHEDGLRALVLAGEGRAFLAGGDVGAFHEAGDGVQEHVRGLIGLLEETITVLDRLRMPVIVRVQGAVAGAGMSLMLTGDVVIAADDTKLAFAYGSIGTTPDGGLSWALPRAVGHLRAMRIALLGEAIDAEEALELGLVTKVVPRDELDAATAKVAGRLAAGPTQAYARTRDLLRSSWRHTLAEQLALERQSFVASAGTEDFREGVAAFVERRRPEFRGS